MKMRSLSAAVVERDESAPPTRAGRKAPGALASRQAQIPHAGPHQNNQRGCERKDEIASEGVARVVPGLNAQDTLAVLLQTARFTCATRVAERWRLREEKTLAEAKPSARVKVNDYWMTKYFHGDGIAIGRLPDFFVEHEVAGGALLGNVAERVARIRRPT